MRCPKCGYISFDHLVACGKCSHDLTEISTMLKGTGFQSLGTFFLSELIPDYTAGSTMIPTPGTIPDFDQEIPDMPISEDLGDPSGLNINISDLEALGDISDLPGEEGTDDQTLVDDELSLEGLEMPEVDLSQFAGDNEDPSVSASPEDNDLSLADHEIPEMDLGEIDFEPEPPAEDSASPAIAPATDGEEDTLFDVDIEEENAAEVSVAPGEDIDLAMEDEEATEEESPEASVSLADIDLSLGEEEQKEVETDEEVMDLADLDLGDVALDLDKDGEAMAKGKDKPEIELPDLELE